MTGEHFIFGASYNRNLSVESGNYLHPFSNYITFVFLFNILNMQISKHKVAGIHYTLRDNDGNVLDSSEGRDPLYYLHGEGNLIPGMENGLAGKSIGDKFQIKVPAEDGYGVPDPQMIQAVPISAFGGQPVQIGMQFQTNQGQVVTVTEVIDDQVMIDANHPLAGQELNFDVEIIDVRDATEEEVTHKHVHGPGGHHH